MSSKPNNVITNAIAANLAALTERLNEAARLAQEASAAMANGKQNEAIGTALGLEKILPDAEALFKAALSLHLYRN